MGHFLGALTQARLDEQRGVVQNEKRQGQNQPYAIAQDLIVRATYPPEHPYGHTVIGSMDDLQAASLEQVREWFRSYYGPSNAILTLTGATDSPHESHMIGIIALIVGAVALVASAGALIAYRRRA